MEKIIMTPFVEWCDDNAFISFSEVRKNNNGYPYVTFLYDDPTSDTGRSAKNIYFAKTVTPQILERVADGESIMSYAKELTAIETINEAGEPRTKLCFASSNYFSVDSLKAEVPTKATV